MKSRWVDVCRADNMDVLRWHRTIDLGRGMARVGETNSARENPEVSARQAVLVL
jgi:hypothetical protein